MSNNQYINLLRDYAAAGKRRNRSYAEQVAAVVDLRLQTALAGVTDPEQVQAVTNEVRGIAMREYGRSDASLSLEAVG